MEKAMLAGNPANPTSPPQDEHSETVPSAAEAEDSGPARIAIRVSEDKLTAFIAVHPPVKVAAGALDADFVQRRWREQGLDPEALTHDAAKAFADEWNSTHAL